MLGGASSDVELTPTQTGAVVGAVLGAAGGAIIGSATGDAGPGLAIGAAGGALTGGVIGREFERKDEELLQQREILAQQGATVDDQGRQINELRRNMGDEYEALAPRAEPEARFQLGEMDAQTTTAGQGQEASGINAPMLPPATSGAVAGGFVNGQFQIPAKNRPSVERVEFQDEYVGSPKAEVFLGGAAEERAIFRAEARELVRARLGFPALGMAGADAGSQNTGLPSMGPYQGAAFGRVAKTEIESQDLMPMVEDARKTALPPANQVAAIDANEFQGQEIARIDAVDELPVQALPEPVIEEPAIERAPAMKVKSFGAASMEPPIVTPSPSGPAKITTSLPSPAVSTEAPVQKSIRLGKGKRLINPGKGKIARRMPTIELGKEIDSAPRARIAKASLRSAASVTPSLPTGSLSDELPLASRPAQSQKALELAALPSSGVRLGDLEKRKPSLKAKQYTPEKEKKKVVAKKAEVIGVAEEVEGSMPVVKIVKSADTDEPLMPKDTNCIEGETEAERARNATSEADKMFYYRRALRLCPKEPVYHIEMGRVYSEIGKSNDARFSFTKALELDPENEIAQDELSLLMLESDSNVY